MVEPPSLQRDRYGEPSHFDDGRGLPSKPYKINFRHPGYDDAENILMVLPGLDHRDAGIHHETARIACAILANNRWAGFFTEDQAGERKVDVPGGAILHKKDYYFRVSSDAAGRQRGHDTKSAILNTEADVVPSPIDKYPIVPTFQDWRFPHGNLPECWAECNIPSVPDGRSLPRQSSLTEALLARDLTCRLTNHIESTEHAHLIPRTEGSWFNRNSMFLYNNLSRVDIDGIDDPQNGILLRSDIHTLFDQKRFVIVPKPSSTLPKMLSFVVQVLTPGVSAQLVKLYHNVLLQQLTGVAVEFLFARLAWTIFSFSKVFLQPAVKRILCVHRQEQSTTREFSGDECRAFTVKSTSRSVSPRKRKPETHETVEGQEYELNRVRVRKRRRNSLLSSRHTKSHDPPWYTDSSGSTSGADSSDVDSTPEKQNGDPLYKGPQCWI